MKFGIIGTNFISDWFALAAGKVQGVEISAVYSRAEQSGRAFAKKYNIENVYTDYARMLSSDIDAVYVASPTFLHESQSATAIEYGKNVLCEKMLCASYSAACRLAEKAEKNRVVLLEAMRPDFDPVNKLIFDSSKKIGKIRRAKFEYCQYSSRYDRFKSGELLNAFDPWICNSALADIGIYPLHMAVLFFGRPEKMKASSILLNNGFEGMGQLTLEYSDMMAEITYSKITEGYSWSCIEGESGSVIFDRVSSPQKVLLCLRGKDVEHLDFPVFADRSENMIYEIRAFKDMVEGRADHRRYLDVTLESIRIATEAYRMSGALAYMNPDYMK